MPIGICEFSALADIVSCVRWRHFLPFGREIYPLISSLTIPENFLLFFLCEVEFAYPCNTTFSAFGWYCYIMSDDVIISRWVGNLLPDFVVFSLSFLEIYWARLKSFFTLLRYAVLYFDWSSRFVDRKHGYCMPDALFHWVWWRADGFRLRPPCVSWESMEKRPVFPWGLTGAFAMCYDRFCAGAYSSPKTSWMRLCANFYDGPEFCCRFQCRICC